MIDNLRTVVELPFARVDLDRRLVYRPGGAIDRLTTMEVNLFRYLLDHEGQVVSRDQLLAEVWGYAATSVSRTCDTAIRRLRQKIELDPSEPECLLTVFGGGYTLAPKGRSTEPPAPTRISEAPSAPRVAFGPRILDLGRATLDGPDGEVALTAREVGILEVLLGARGAAVDRDSLQRRVWGSAGGRAIENTVSRLRRKLEPDPSAPRFLLTTVSGYRLESGPEGDGVPARGRLEAALPAEVDARFGRARELDHLVGLFSAGDRLVTLTGPGGVGKSRLALAAGSRLAELSSTGKIPERPAIWIDLSDARTVDRLSAAVAVALRLQLGDGDPVVALGDAARALGPALLVLDNLEQLVPHGVGPLVTWLEQAPELWLLVTSRAALGLRGERRLTVGPLSLDAGVALFVDRAPHPPDPADPDLRSLVEELGGLPLALELAASRTSVLSVRELRARLSDQLQLLAVADPSRPARHRSLRACIDTSVALLSTSGQAGLAQLGVFAGRFGVDQVEDVLALPTPVSTIDTLQELVEASLIASDVAPGWFAMAAHVQEYALERLGADRPQVEARHRRAYAALGHPDAISALDGPGEPEARAVLTRQFDNLLRAFDDAIAENDGPSALFAASAAWEVVALVGPYRLALGWIEPLLAATVDDELHARALVLAGRIRRAAGALVEAEEALTRAVRVAAALGSAEIGAQAHLELAALRASFARTDQPDSDPDIALGLARTLDSPILICRALCAAGRNLLARYRVRDAQEVLRAALTLAQDLGARRREAEIRRWIGLCLDRLGRPEAQRELQRAAQLALDLGDRRLEAEILLQMAVLGPAMWHAWGAAALEEAVRLFEDLGDRSGLVDALVSTAIQAINAERFDRAEQAIERAEGLALSIGVPTVRAKVAVRRGVLERLRGRPDVAVQLFEEVMISGDDRVRHAAHGQLGWCALQRGDVEEARRIWSEDAAISTKRGDLPTLAGLEVWLGVACLRVDIDAAVAHWDRAAELGWANDLLSVAIMSSGNAANTLAEAGREAEAMERLRRLEGLDVSESPGLGIMRAVAFGGVEQALGRDPSRWSAEADLLADTHHGGRAMPTQRERIRRSSS